MTDEDAKHDPEHPATRFKRVGNARLNKALDAIELVGNLTGPTYESTPEQIDTIQATLEDEVARAVDKLRRDNGRGLL